MARRTPFCSPAGEAVAPVENALIRLTIGSIAFLALSALIAAGPLGAKGVEGRLKSRADDEIGRAGLSWARIRAEGATIHLSGEAPSEEDLRSAIDMLDRLGPGRIVSTGVSLTASTAAAASPSLADPGPISERSGQSTETAATDAPSSASSIDDCRDAMRRALNGRRITFRSESASLNRSDHAILNDLALEMRSCDGFAIDIEGHTDASGSAVSNMRLSGLRARAVADYLAPRAPATIFAIKAYGESRPIASNRTIEGRRANRRIEFALAATPAENGTSDP